ncbi:hypothetical protein [Photobacterium kishitanii]|uniref:hypothetical protein n=1 Tax=Photobacterium kishitanii TaxID=318456 RepID=UPI0015E6527F|nr:hypothetical protein [Photobacterium kishitanii]
MKKSTLLVICVLSALSFSSVSLVAQANDRPTTLPSERSGLQIWNKETVYTKGDSARYLGRLWVAKWCGGHKVIVLSVIMNLVRGR